MSILRLGRNPDGSRQTEDLGPGKGRVSGYGGSLVVHAITVAAPIRHRLPRDQLSLTRPRPKCGHIMPRFGEPCARMPGHQDDHRPASYMIQAAARRRAL